ncbi:MAG: LTA synthase family protein [Lachnospiraceae bacterium]|nr:LTA synthase family protein [Lachnospiraceae bacterium]
MKSQVSNTKISWHIIKRSFFFLLLLVYAFLAVTHSSVFYHDFAVKESAEYTTRVVLGQTDELKQEFVAKGSHLSAISVRFRNPARKLTTGEVVLELYNPEDELIGTYSFPTKAVQHSKRTVFPIEAELTKGETYYYKVICKDVVNKNCFYIKLAPSAENSIFKTLTWNDYETSMRIDGKFYYQRYDWKLIIVASCLWLFLLGLILIPEKTWDSFKDTKWNRRLGQFLFILSPFVSFWLVERFNETPITSLMKVPVYFGLNLLVYFSILMLLYLITNRTRISALILIISTFLLGCTSYFIDLFRGSPLLPNDFASIGTAFNVASNYTLTMDLLTLCNILLLMAFCIPVCLLPGSKGLSLKPRLAFLLGTCLCVGSTYYIYFGSTTIKDLGMTINVWQPQKSYHENGFALCFTVHASYSIPSKPDGYKAAMAEEIASRYQSDSVTEATKEQPNVICIMNESFTDLTFLNNVETSEDIMPFIHNMSENTIKGHLYVSVFGGNTADTEFEFLTGNSMAFLPYRSIPYNYYIKSALPSLTYTMEGAGYAGNIAMHPYKPGGWKRDTIYPLLGFQNFISESAFKGSEYLRRFVSDDANYDKIIEEYETSKASSSDPFYLFNVTIQNHGSYGYQSGTMDEPIDFKDTVLNNDSSAHQFINLIHRSDEAVERLVTYFENVEEPTVICFWGDHLPKLADSIYERIYGKSLDSLSIEQTSRMYSTPFFIWANYDIPEEEIDGISANYLSSYLLKTLGLPMTGYNKYLMDLYEKLPVVSQICYKDSEGNTYDPEDENFPYEEELEEYHVLQYNNMFDTSNRVEDFFTLNGMDLSGVSGE